LRASVVCASVLRAGGRFAVVGAGLAVVTGAVTTLENHDPALATSRALGLDRPVLPVDTRHQSIEVTRQQRTQAVAERRTVEVAAPQRARAAVRAAAARAAAVHVAAVRVAAVADVSRSAARDPRGAARVMLADYGWGSGQFSCLEALWAKESGWNPSAMNPSSGAFGIPQALPGSKMASAGADWRTSPVTQIRWGLGYIKGIYGSPCVAWGHSQATNWY
jgi:hypothetical protein